jgi:hypothetical protein
MPRRAGFRAGSGRRAGRGLTGRLVGVRRRRHDASAWRTPAPVRDRETLDGIIRKLMSIDDKLVRLVDELLEDDGEEEVDA